MEEKTPKHIAIIMDGNGRWAKARGNPRMFGHREGAKAVRRVVEACPELGIEYLTLYTFSSENWSRPKEEVDGLMSLLEDYLKSETDELHKNNVRLRVIGDKARLSKKLQDLISKAENKMAKNTGLTVVTAISYGGRDEIVEAVKKIAAQVKEGGVGVEDINGELIKNNLYAGDIPDPDLIVRTSGEQRISNFLLWQMAYSEFYFMDVMWPDFDKNHLLEAINEFKKRNRRFGKV